MKVLRMVMSGTTLRQAAMRSKVFSAAAGRFINFKNACTGVLERNVQIRQHFAVGHQLDDLIDMGVGIHIVQPNPDAEFAQRGGEIVEARTTLLDSRHGCEAYFKSTP